MIHPSRRSTGRPMLAAMASTVVLLLALCLPGDAMGEDEGLPFSPPPGSDKVVHATLFFVETRCLRRALQAAGHGSPLALALVAAVFLGVVTETAQLFIPGRDGNRYDLLADALGAGLYAGIVRWRRVQEIAGKHPGPSPNQKLSGRGSRIAGTTARDES